MPPLLPHPLRTLQVVNVRWLNATAWYGLEVARLLNAAGHETRVLGLEGTESFAAATALGLQPIPLSMNLSTPIKFAQSFAAIRRLLTEFQPHVVNCHRGEGFVLWGVLKHAFDYALVRTRGDQRLPRNNAPNRWLYRHTADALIPTNTLMARHFVNTLGVDPKRVHTVFGGVDTSRFYFDEARRAAVRERLGIAPETCVIGLLGRFDHVKGQRETINAIARLIAEGRTHVHLLLLGFTTAITQKTVEGWICDAGMERYVQITGKVDDVVGHLCALDVGVVASLWSETIARAALEIMACGRPLVSTAVGVMPDLLPKEALCAPGDEVALARLLGRTVDDAAFRERLMAWNTERMQTLTSDVFLEQVLAVYAAALQRAF